MPEPPVVPFGRAPDEAAWWATLPSGAVLHRGRLNDLLSAVETAMNVELPARPFSFSLDAASIRQEQ
ncbi:hypothetical protein I6A60_32940 [Frankia sp. AgB1.9]|uniref:hypothetical protein n=1 Tax=unclassified Frankia TaxID=2632575 RepID=UPI0019327661|nr:MULTISPECIES: hypothetical protein [unclassified Frankia]MBL7489767.1 hypothetical protein [Frankia sp. AgW1.1]MBL7552630.1 hypothetical protein [Frankia sp. AgB1.9]MBL7623718.1 hypothetical protein [Frankia sp. AgB1.8]